MDINALFVIAARAGSKGVPGKNISDLGGIPLLAYPIRRALRLAPAERVWVSTDSEEYAGIARHYGASVPFIRPAEWATDAATSTSVLNHALGQATRKGIEPEIVVLLEPTSPFIRLRSLRTALEKLVERPDARSIVAVRETHPHSFFVQPEREYLDEVSSRIRGRASVRRQDFPREITPSGGFYAARTRDFLEQGTYYTDRTLAHEVALEEGLEIDSALDLEFARFLIDRGRIPIHELY